MFCHGNTRMEYKPTVKIAASRINNLMYDLSKFFIRHNSTPEETLLTLEKFTTIISERLDTDPTLDIKSIIEINYKGEQIASITHEQKKRLDLLITVIREEIAANDKKQKQKKITGHKLSNLYNLIRQEAAKLGEDEDNIASDCAWMAIYLSLVIEKSLIVQKTES